MEEMVKRRKNANLFMNSPREKCTEQKRADRVGEKRKTRNDQTLIYISKINYSCISLQAKF